MRAGSSISGSEGDLSDVGSDERLMQPATMIPILATELRLVTGTIGSSYTTGTPTRPQTLPRQTEAASTANEFRLADKAYRFFARRDKRARCDKLIDRGQ